jgi:hypothetical protein
MVSCSEQAIPYIKSGKYFARYNYMFELPQREGDSSAARRNAFPSL